jgi:acetylornithine/N-succinyldiaminopimelate aminotransferase
VQTGIGRTGKLFAHEWAGITPDIMAIAKGFGGGFPVGACLATNAAGEAMTAGSHGSTFGGNPLAMAVANAVLDIVLAPGFVEDVARKGDLLAERLAALQAAHGDIIREVRGHGLMRGLKTSVPNAAFIAALLDEHLLTIIAGDNVTRLLPPLIVEDRHIDEACDRIDRVCRTLSGTAKLAS